MENQNVNDKNVENRESTQQDEAAQAASEQKEEKLFTQEEVNRIVGERLARVKNQPDSSGYAEREQALNQREMQLNARERLIDAGMPKELLPLVNCNSKKDMENSLNLISTYFKAPGSSGRTYRVSTGIAGNRGSSVNHSEYDVGRIRAAMGLKG